MGEGVGPWTDLYATGVIAYELLSRPVPFGNREPIAILLAHLQEAAASAGRARAGRTRADRRVGRRAAGQGPRGPPAVRAGRLGGARGAPARVRRAALAPQRPARGRARRGGTDAVGRPITPAASRARPGRRSRSASRPTPPRRCDAPRPRRPGRRRRSRATPPAPPRRPGRARRRRRAAPRPPPRPTPPADRGPPPAGRPRRHAGRSPGRHAGLGLAAGGRSPSRRSSPSCSRSRFPAARRTTSLCSGAPRRAARPAARSPLGDAWLRAVHVVSYDPDGLREARFHRRRSAAPRRRWHARRRSSPMLDHDSLESAELEVKRRADGRDARLPASRPPNAKASDGHPALSRAPDIYPALRAPGPGRFFDAYRSASTPGRTSRARAAPRRSSSDDVLAARRPEHTDRWSALLKTRASAASAGDLLRRGHRSRRARSSSGTRPTRSA